MAKYHPSDELLQLLNALADEQLTEEQEVRLADILKADKQARRLYLDYVAMLTSMQWEYAEAAVPPETRAPSRLPRSWRSYSALIATVAAVVLVGVAIGVTYFLSGETQGPLATLESSGNARWGSGNLPTEVGARLGKGRMTLTGGIAGLKFTNGTIVHLEGPAELQLQAAGRCALLHGRMMVEVPESTVDFVVETPTAVITDPGTAFGIHVLNSESTEVSVFEGTVEVMHRQTGSQRTMQVGDNVRFTQEHIQPFLPDTSEEPNQGNNQANKKVVRITTGQGNGEDDYIESTVAVKKKFRSSTLLLVKNAPATTKAVKFRNRKAYLRFDLTGIEKTRITAAELALTSTPSGIGFASQVKDATFSVYGLTDESQDNWTKDMTWDNAPANQRDGKRISGGSDINKKEVVKLGTFEIPQGKRTGTFRIHGDALTRFLQQDSNGLVTLIVVRETQGSGRIGLVHAFASHRHPTLSPPTLKLTVRSAASK